MKDKIFGVLQRVGRSFMLPIAILPVAGLLLGLGSSFTNETMLKAYGLLGIMGPGTVFNAIFQVMSDAGNIVFTNLPIIFAMGVAIGMAKKEKEVAALAAAIAFFIMHASIGAMITINGGAEKMLEGATTDVVGITSLQMGVFGGIIVGLGVAALDDPEHISIDGYSEKLSKILEEVNGELSRLINNFDNGRIVKEGVKTVILGKPNAGKSSLLNLLLGEERAIVTDIEGTTRDTLEESINLNGVFLNLIDTAGIRDSEDVVEQIGVNKAKELAEKSDLVIFVADASKELDENDKEIINLIKDKQAIVLLNKSDLGTIINEKNVSEFDNKPVITFSAKTGDGLDELENKIRDLFYEGKVKYNDELYITNARQKESLINAKNSIEEVIKSVENDMPEDFYSIDLMDAYTYLGQIIGESVEDDLVNEIFSKFCMGK